LRPALSFISDNEWVVKLYASFDDEEFLYLVMHFLPGGDLMTLLQREDVLSHQVLGLREQGLGFRSSELMMLLPKEV